MERFFARLRGANEVPPVFTNASGRAFFRVVERNHDHNHDHDECNEHDEHDEGCGRHDEFDEDCGRDDEFDEDCGRDDEFDEDCGRHDEFDEDRGCHDEHHDGHRRNRRRRLRLKFLIRLRNIRHVRRIDLHLGRRRENGPVVAVLFRRRHRGNSGNHVVFGSISRRDLVGPLRGHSLRALIRQIKRGNVYINVHTRRHPRGEIRGQLRKVRHHEA